MYLFMVFSIFLRRFGVLSGGLCVLVGVFSSGLVGSSGLTIKVYMNFGCVLLRSPL